MQNIPKVLKEEEQQILLDSFNTRYITPKRNKLMVRLMLNSGLRVGEVTALIWTHVDLSSGILDVKEGKGDRDRRLFLSEALCQKLALWRNEQIRWLENKPTYVFTTKNNTQIHTRYIRAMITRACEKTGLDPSIHPHTLRHTFATDLYKKTKDIRLVQKAMGHSNIETTMIYTHVVDEDLENEMKNLREPVKV